MRALAAEGMNRSGSGDNLATMPESARDEVFFSGPERNAFVVKNQGIAALDDYHVLVVVVDVWGRKGGLVAGPECHLTPTDAVINVAFNTRCGLTGGRDSVCGRLHELRKIFHCFYPNSKKSQKPTLTAFLSRGQFSHPARACQGLEPARNALLESVFRRMGRRGAGRGGARASCSLC